MFFLRPWTSATDWRLRADLHEVVERVSPQWDQTVPAASGSYPGQTLHHRGETWMSDWIQCLSTGVCQFVSSHDFMDFTVNFLLVVLVCRHHPVYLGCPRTSTYLTWASSLSPPASSPGWLSWLHRPVERRWWCWGSRSGHWLKACSKP